MNDLIVARLDGARLMLLEARDSRGAKRVADLARAAEVYAKRAKLGEEAIGYAFELKTDALVLMAEFREKEGKQAGSRGIGNPKSGVPKGNPTPRSSAELGLSKKESAEASQLLKIKRRSGATYEQVKKREVSLKQVTSAARRETKLSEVRERVSQPAAIPTGRRFSVLYADPPWRYDFAESPTREVENQYPTLTLDQIKALRFKIGELADKDSVLFLWATSPKLQDALETLVCWGFTYRTCMVWVKDKIGMGYYARQQHEILLIGARGNLPTPEPATRPASVIVAPRGRHSAKPEPFAEAIERMYPDLPRIELFARRPRAGWTAWGNELAP